MTCHGSAGLGADTNVWDGVFQARDGDNSGDHVYNTDGELLNGGGFNPTMYPTQHYPGAVTWVAWGAGNNGRDGIISMGGEKVDISCTVCHDTHGSSNYRLLKDVVVGVSPLGIYPTDMAVGGYDVDGVTPTPYVISAEHGYPETGWPKGSARMTLYETYFPDFTTPMYAKAPADDPTKGISGWCQACHTQMNTAGDSGNVFDANGSAFNADGSYNALGEDGLGTGFQDYLAEVYDANDGFGLVERHRHPTNVEMSLFQGGGSPLAYGGVPLAHDPGEGNAGGTPTDASTDWVDCLSCHVAHGSGATMAGYASVANTQDMLPNSGTKTVQIDANTIVSVGSVPPDYGNALLRLDNRGVCQACHNK
jgi:hypothetical protein